MTFDNVTRIHVVPDGGSSIEYWADHWHPELQDDGKTLKLFGTGTGQQAKDDRGEALAEFIRYVQPTLPEHQAKLAAKLLGQINDGTFRDG